LQKCKKLLLGGGASTDEMKGSYPELAGKGGRISVRDIGNFSPERSQENSNWLRFLII
jgi:hypothetical protein